MPIVHADHFVIHAFFVKWMFLRTLQNNNILMVQALKSGIDS